MTLLTLIANALAMPLPADGEALNQQLEDAYTSAARRWPAARLSREAYAARLARLMEGKPDPFAVLSTLLLEELYLTSACAAGDEAAQVYFNDQFLSQIPTFIAGLRLSEAQVEDVQHSLRERLLFAAEQGERRIGHFAGQGALAQWLRVSAVRAGLNLKRNKNTQAVAFDPADIVEQVVARDGDPELELLRRRYQQEFKAAVRAAFAALSEDDRGVLHMYYVGGLNTRQIAKLYSVVSTTASRWVDKARDRLSAAALASLRASLNVNDTQIRSLYRALASQMDLSLRAVLNDKAVASAPAAEPDLSRELGVALAAAKAAAAVVAEVYERGFRVDYKQGDDPITEADRRANELLKQTLAKAFPADAICAEEDDAAESSRQAARGGRCWFIDPLDGTREFIARSGEFCVMVGLAVAGRPVLGVVVAPAQGRTYVGVTVGPAAQAYVSDEQGQRRPLRAQTTRGVGAARVVLSRLHRNAEVEAAAALLGINHVRECGSTGLKFLQVASGEVDLYLHSGAGPKLWDGCAPEAIALAAGAEVSDAAGRLRSYATAALDLAGGIVVAAPPLREQAAAALRAAQADESP